MEYPQPRKAAPKIQEHQVWITSEDSSAHIRTPNLPVMGPVGYPPATSSQEPFNINLDGWRRRGGFTYRGNSNVTLPSAQQPGGALLVLPNDIGLYEDAISRWENITLNALSDKDFPDRQSKMIYMENLLGENEKKVWVQWRQAYPKEYEGITNLSDDTQNVTSQIRRMFILEDPYQGSTIEQNRAYHGLERLSCENIKDIIPYLKAYETLAIKSGRLYMGDELTEKIFRKVPSIIGEELEKGFRERYPGTTTAVIPKIKFAYDFLTEMCKKAALTRALKELSFCSDVRIPGYFPRPKLGLRKAEKFTAGKPHKTHVRVISIRHPDRLRKCKCFICAEEGHFSRDCKQKHGNIERAHVTEQLELPQEWDVVSIDNDESDSSSICSISENEQESNSFLQNFKAKPYESPSFYRRLWVEKKDYIAKGKTGL